MGRRYCCLGNAFRATSIAALLLGMFEVAQAQGAPVTLRWNANPERDIAGYRLYYGTDPRAYTQTIEVGNKVTTTISNLPGGTVYFFALTAYNTAGFESRFSNAVTYTAPVATPPPNPTATPTPIVGIAVSPASIEFSAVAGGSIPAPQSIQVATVTGVAWIAVTDSSWFSIAPNIGPSGSFTIVTPHTEGLIAGTYADAITFSAPGLVDKVVEVTLTVTPGLDPTVNVSDDFNRPDGDLGPNWTSDLTWGSGLSISGNKVVATNSGVHYWTANPFWPDQYSEIRLTGPMASWSGVLVRGNPRPAPFYLVKVNQTGADLYSSLNGLLTQLAHDATIWATGDVLKLAVRTVAGNTAHLTVYRNGAELFSYDDATSFIGGGQPGIGMRNGTQGMSLDDWKGGCVRSVTGDW